MKMRAILLAAAFGAVAAPAVAERWEIVVNPYFMAPTSDGKFGVGPLESSIGSSPADIFRRLNWGVMGAVEVGNGNWAFALDVNYLNVDLTDDSRRQVSVNGHQAAYTLMVMKRIDPKAEVYAGLKLSDFGLRLECSPSCPAPSGNGGAIDVSRNRSWMEPLVGLRIRHDISNRWELVVAGDIGGFSVGSDFSANVWPQIGYRIGDRVSGLVGYRVIYVQYDEGEGRERFLYDAVTHGPTIGLEIRF
jgi:hypothetical protein